MFRVSGQDLGYRVSKGFRSQLAKSRARTASGNPSMQGLHG